jgi:TPP-dependent indolepyruvate ferredoxin oxidoreductase alpha subunit
LALAGGEKPLLVRRQPEILSLRGTQVCTYEYLAGYPGDRVHVILVDAGNRVYEVTSFMKSSLNEDLAAEISAVQISFVKYLLW